MVRFVSFKRFGTFYQLRTCILAPKAELVGGRQKQPRRRWGVGLWETVERKPPNLTEGLTFGPSRKMPFFPGSPPFLALPPSLSIFQLTPLYSFPQSGERGGAGPVPESLLLQVSWRKGQGMGLGTTRPLGFSVGDPGQAMSGLSYWQERGKNSFLKVMCQLRRSVA